jgi:hypothetical protein
MSAPTEIAEGIARHLDEHLGLCREILAVVEEEGRAWRPHGGGDPYVGVESKKNLLPRLNRSLDQLRKNRALWQQFRPAERARHTQIAWLLRAIQELTMKIIVRDREHEQALLRLGRLPPGRLPPVNRQRPHYVADLYRRQRAG